VIDVDRNIDNFINKLFTIHRCGTFEWFKLSILLIHETLEIQSFKNVAPTIARALKFNEIKIFNEFSFPIDVSNLVLKIPVFTTKKSQRLRLALQNLSACDHILEQEKTKRLIEEKSWEWIEGLQAG
jgi:hypothetical protein